jgi:hypothetical protein
VFSLYKRCHVSHTDFLFRYRVSFRRKKKEDAVAPAKKEVAETKAAPKKAAAAAVEEKVCLYKCLSRTLILCLTIHDVYTKYFLT